MKNMRFKVGDRVRIKSLDWYNENKDEFGNIDINEDFTFYADRSRYCGKVFTISEVFDNCYSVKEDNNEYFWIDEMIEGLVFRIGEGTMSFAGGQISHTKSASELYEEYIKKSLNKETNKIISNANAGDMLAEKTMLDCILAKGLLIPNGYEIKDEKGNVINATKIVLEKKKPKYPKTYEECCKVMNYCCNPVATKTTHKEELIRKFQFLLMYRDAYWKIAGEEMGLGKPWEPPYGYEPVEIFCIHIYQNRITKVSDNSSCHYTLAFPTEEMRDAFYENFKEEIEMCKELL